MWTYTNTPCLVAWKSAAKTLLASALSKLLKTAPSRYAPIPKETTGSLCCPCWKFSDLYCMNVSWPSDEDLPCAPSASATKFPLSCILRTPPVPLQEDVCWKSPSQELFWFLCAAQNWDLKDEAAISPEKRGNKQTFCWKVLPVPLVEKCFLLSFLRCSVGMHG